MYKYSKECEEYLSYNLKKYHRSLFAQFRSGILPLNIETGRFRGLDLCDRICPVCDVEVEDEVHFLCKCPKYTEYRNVLFGKASAINPDFHTIDILDQFVFLMSNLQKDVIRFLVKAVETRKSIVNLTI